MLFLVNILHDDDNQYFYSYSLPFLHIHIYISAHPRRKPDKVFQGVQTEQSCTACSQVGVTEKELNL